MPHCDNIMTGNVIITENVRAGPVDCYCAHSIASILLIRVSGFKGVDSQGESAFLRRLK